MPHDQPFYVPIGKGKTNLATGQRGGYYLPALEPPAEDIQPTIPQAPWSLAQIDTVDQLRLGFGYLNRSFAILEKEVKERTSKKGRFKDYE